MKERKIGWIRVLEKILMDGFIRQLISYFCVGGIAAIVEWIMFFFFSSIVNINYMFATIFAFVFSTSVNWFLGRKFTFKDSNKYRRQVGKEIFYIFFVSIIGLGFNLVLMYLFVTVIGMNTNLLMTVSKVMATGIVFMWNFFIRKLAIYRG